MGRRGMAARPRRPPSGSPPPPSAASARRRRRFLGSDAVTAGNFAGKFGRDGYVLIGYDVPNSRPGNPFCGLADENSVLELTCTAPGATIAAIVFASFGTPATGGGCPAFAAGACSAQSSLSVLVAACVGQSSCTVNATNDVFGGDPCVGQLKSLAVVANCTSGGGIQPGGKLKPQDRSSLPPYVAATSVVDSADFSGARFNWVTDSADARALADPGNSSHRALGLMQPHHDCPTAPFDVLLTDAAIAAGTRYRFSAYFVDWGVSPENTFSSTARAQEVYLLEGYPDFSPKAPREVLTNFSEGIWLSWDIAGSVRLRISSISGNYAALSAVAFDPVDTD